MGLTFLRKTWWIIFLPILLGVCYLLAFSKAPEGPCPIESLLLDIEDLQGGPWEETGSRSTKDAPSRIGIERVGTSFIKHQEGGVLHDVYRFVNLSDAIDGYEDLAGSWFYPNEKRSDWIKPPQLERLSTNATQYQVGCSIYLPTDEERCQWIALYETYIVFLSVDIPTISYDAFGTIINTLDQKMTNCLFP